jgi:hypothetical protein
MRSNEDVERAVLTDPHARRRAWLKNSRCVECGHPIDHPTKAGVLGVNGVARVAHKNCFGAAVAKHNPTFSVKRVERVD